MFNWEFFVKTHALLTTFFVCLYAQESLFIASGKTLNFPTAGGWHENDFF